jgi:hypothetical protein
MKIDIATMLLAADILDVKQVVAAVVHVEYRRHRHPLQSPEVFPRPGVSGSNRSDAPSTAEKAMEPPLSHSMYIENSAILEIVATGRESNAWQYRSALEEQALPGGRNGIV